MKCCGFTIIELVLVIVIVVTLAAIVVPIFDSSVPQIVLESEARKLASELRYVQQKAVFTNRTHILVISLGDSSVTVYSVDSNSVAAKEYSYVVDDPVEIAKTSFSDGTFYFNPMGGPSDGGTISLTNGSDHIMTIHIAAFTGKVSISRD